MKKLLTIMLTLSCFSIFAQDYSPKEIGYARGIIVDRLKVKIKTMETFFPNTLADEIQLLKSDLAFFSTCKGSSQELLEEISKLQKEYEENFNLGLTIGYDENFPEEYSEEINTNSEAYQQGLNAGYKPEPEDSEERIFMNRVILNAGQE